MTSAEFRSIVEAYDDYFMSLYEDKSFTGDLVKPDGVLYMRVKHSGKQRSEMGLFVVDSRTPALFGRDLLRSLPPNWSEIKELQKAT